MINLLLHKWHFHKEEKNQLTLCKKKKKLYNKASQEFRKPICRLLQYAIKRSSEYKPKGGYREWNGAEMFKRIGSLIRCGGEKKRRVMNLMFLTYKGWKYRLHSKMFMLACCFKPDQRTFNLMWWFWISSLASEKYILCYKLAS